LKSKKRTRRKVRGLMRSEKRIRKLGQRTTEKGKENQEKGRIENGKANREKENQGKVRRLMEMGNWEQEKGKATRE